MRKIESQMNAAIQGNQNWSSGNTQVVTNMGVSTVYLHGNKIALVDENSLTLFDGGWQNSALLVKVYFRRIISGLWESLSVQSTAKVYIKQRISLGVMCLPDWQIETGLLYWGQLNRAPLNIKKATTLTYKGTQTVDIL